MPPRFDYEPLTPTAYLERAGTLFADRIGVIEGATEYTWATFRERCLKFAGALREAGVAPGDRVAVLAPNSAMLLAAHYAVPWSGAVLVALNTRVTAADIAWILGHSGARLLLHDAMFAATAAEAVAKAPAPIETWQAGGSADSLESRIAAAAAFRHRVDDERALLAIDYTSGTTGPPKGVMYHHRGAYLQALAMAYQMKLDSDSVYLWTLPMFHCNGWCFPWAVTAAGARHVCLPRVDAASIWHHLGASGITHFCGAPTLLTMAVWDPDARPLGRPVHIATGGAPPTPALLERLATLGMDITHLYGLTETYGPSVICEWKSEWNALPLPDQARIKARQGVANVIGEPLRVVDHDGCDVPADGSTMGEIAIRGNNVMLGYYRNDEATRNACPDGWFRTGDLGVMHTDGYVELRDRAKDIIISGGENIASVEVEQAITSHPAVLEVGVVAGPDEKWGEIPVAWVALKDGAAVTERELIDHVRARIAHFKAPRRVIFGPLPKTATGKIQKNVLRERLRAPVGRG